MGLLSTEVEIVLSGKNIPYYESLGYEIPRRLDKKKRMKIPEGTKIMVNINDLSLGSTALVDVKCDNCAKKFKKRYCNYLRQLHDGKTYCCDCVNAVLHSRENNNNWNPNLTDDERIIKRTYPEYIDFVKKVLARDNYICQCCGNTYNDLDVHHIDGYDWCVEKRIDETNGITLCKDCHKNFHLRYGKGGNTKAQFGEWIGYAIGQLKKYDGKLVERQVICIETNEIFNNKKEVANKLGCDVIEISRCCNHIRKYACDNKHYLYLDEYKNMSNSDLEKFLDRNNMYSNNNGIRLYCLNTGELFYNLTIASKKYNISAIIISKACKGEAYSAGKLLDGDPLLWMFKEDVDKRIIKGETIEDIYKEKLEMYYNRGNTQRVVCLNTLHIYNTCMEAGNDTDTCASNIGRCCNGKCESAGLNKETGEPYFWVHYNDYLKMTHYDIEMKKIPKLYVKVICLNTNEVFYGLKKAKEKYKACSIAQCCSGIINYSGIHPITEEKLVWMYYKDYINSSDEEIKIKINARFDNKFLSIICLNTLEVFNSASQAAKWCGLCNISRITDCCKGKAKTSGVHPETGERLRWMYYKDYLILNDNDKNKEELAV